MSKKALPGIKALIVAAMSLALLIPVLMLGGLVKERKELARSVEAEIANGAGGELLIAGPFLGVPVTEREGREVKQHTALILPDTLAVRGTANAEIRKRGIYSSPVFDSVVEIEAEYLVSRAECERIFSRDSEVDLSRAQLYLEIPDPRALRSPLSATLGDGRSLALATSVGAYEATGSIMGAALSLSEGKLTVKMKLAVGGGGSIRVFPLGNSNSIALAANWPSPSFTGSILPTFRDLREDGFSAEWNQAAGSRRWPKVWSGENNTLRYERGAAVGVELFSSVDAYHKTERSLKYAILFLVIPFLAIFLFELFTGSRIHPIQYCLIGFADVVFYALLLSLGEHLPYSIAYWAAALAVMALVSLYASSILKSLPKGFALAPVLGLLYLYLYSALESEDWALLIGSIGVFAILATVMYLTRNINWYSLKSSSDILTGEEPCAGSSPSDSVPPSSRPSASSDSDSIG